MMQIKRTRIQILGILPQSPTKFLDTASYFDRQQGIYTPATTVHVSTTFL